MVRRVAIALSLATVAAAATAATRVRALDAAPNPSLTHEPSEAWLTRMKGKHRQFFDNPSPNGGIALVHVLNYFDAYNKVYGVEDKDINAVLTFYGATTFYALSDSVWAKYRLGEFLDTKDVLGKPATANPWRTAPVVLGVTFPSASLESLQKRGATLILCNNALEIFSNLLAAKRDLDPKAVYADLKANILPGVDLVPAMVIAVEQAQRMGLTYHRQ
jgi:intracellular sulfur oxidation DsrE/DsrF family protein